MVRRGRRATVDRDQSGRYLRVARALRRSAGDLADLADAGDRYGNAIAILAVHSAIAYADALSIPYGGFRSTEGDHERDVDVLKKALGIRAEPGRIKALLGVVRRKDVVSYQGEYFTVTEARAFVEQLRGFAEWAEEMHEGRP